MTRDRKPDRECDIELDRNTGTVTLQDAEITLTKRPFAVLEYLVDHRDRVVSKDEIIENVWNCAVVSDAALASAISSVRRALSVFSQKNSPIRTIYGRGFQYVGIVKDIPLPSTPRGGQRSASPPYVAVLPLECLSEDPVLKTVADGVVQDITLKLSKFRDVRVLPRSTACSVRRLGLTMKEAASLLNAHYVLEGSVRQLRQVTRLTVHLLDTSTEETVWSEYYDCSNDRFMDATDALSSQIATWTVAMVFEHSWRNIRFRNLLELDAWEHYAAGRALVFRSDEAAQDKALLHFQRASALEPRFAESLACQAIALTYKNSFADDAKRARGLDPRSTPDRIDALKAAERAIDICSQAPIAWNALSIANYCLGNVDRAVAAAERALALCPESGWAQHLIGLNRCQMNRPEEALIAFRKAVAASPNDPHCWAMLAGQGFAKVLQKQYEEAINISREAQRERHADLLSFVGEISSLGHLGRTAEASEAIDRAIRVLPEFGLKLVKHTYPLTSPAAHDAIINGLERAGVR